MTDWLPWGFVVMLGMYTTLGLVLRALEKSSVIQKKDLRLVKIFFWFSILLSLIVYSLYLITGEAWIWYF